MKRIWEKLAAAGTAAALLLAMSGCQANGEGRAAEDSFAGRRDNIHTVLHINHRSYTVGPGNSEILTDILLNLDYFPDVCNCSPEFTVGTGLAGSYGIHLSNSYARCSKGQAELTQQQVDQIRAIVETVTKE